MKAKYIKPTVIVQKLETEQLLAALSTGSGTANPNKPNLGKQYDFIDEAYILDISSIEKGGDSYE